MDGNGPTLPQRVTAVLHARQYVVFYGIALYALDTALPLLSAWLYRHRPIAELLTDARDPLVDAVAGPSVVIGLLFAAYLLISSWLRSGYIRSLAGPLRLRPRDTRQYLRLLAFELLLEVVAAAAVGTILLADESAAVVDLVTLALLAVYLIVLYADYAIVLSDLGVLRGLLASWRTVRANLAASALVVLSVTLLVRAGAGLLDGQVTGSLAHALPMLVVQCVLLGAVVFAADVTLVVVYQVTLERSAAHADGRRGLE